MASTLSSRVVNHSTLHTPPRPASSLRSRQHVVAPALRTPAAAGASVFAAVRRNGPIARDSIAAVTGLSIATVNRQVSSLLDGELLRERADLAVAGAIGRPRVPVEVNHEPYLTVGLHIGARITGIVATDLLGRTLDAVEMPTPAGPQAASLAALADSARRYLARWHRRRPLWVGVAIGGVVDSGSGHVDHSRLGWSHAPVGRMLGSALGLPVSVASHVDAMAGAELLLTPRWSRLTSSEASILYVYARETVGFALVIDGRVHTPVSGPGTMAGLPVHSELLGATPLENAVSDEAVVSVAHRIGVLPPANSNSSISALMRLARHDDTEAGTSAREILAERARVLGGAVALLRGLLNPDHVVVGGQAFTEYPEGLPHLRSAFAERSLLVPRDIHVTVFGNRVQEAGAGMVSLSSLYVDPLGALRRARPRRPGVSA